MQDENDEQRTLVLVAEGICLIHAEPCIDVTFSCFQTNRYICQGAAGSVQGAHEDVADEVDSFSSSCH